MANKDKKIIKTCTCGKKLTIEETKYIGVMMGLHLFNCMYCKSSIVIKGIK